MDDKIWLTRQWTWYLDLAISYKVLNALFEIAKREIIITL